MLIVKYDLQIRRKGTTNFGNIQVYIAKKCRFFGILVQIRY